MEKRIVKKKNRGADSSLAQVARAGKRCLFVSGWLLPLFLIFSCQNDPPAVNVSPNAETALFSKLPASETGIDFVNKVEDGKEFNVLTYRNFYNGGGVGIGDINNDGLDDVFFTANMASNRLYLNKGDLKFEDISESSGIAGKRGWSTGVSMVDINADGWMDIYVSNSGNISGDDRENELYINNGDLTFTERAKEYNLANGGFSTHASFFDYDGDGDLDCYILNNSFKDPKQLASFSKTREGDDPLGGDRLMRNDNGVFKDVSKAAGLYTSAIGFGLGVSVSDINQDYLPDIYISNDFWERDYIYINQGDGSFSEELMERVNICSVSSMGADVADLNNDGSMDIFTTDMLAADNYRLKVMTMFDPFYLDNLKYRESFHYQVLQNCLQINDGSGNFTEMANMSEAAATDWSWGALIFDFDNDGWQDIYVCNGIYRDIMDQDFTNFITDKDEIKNVVSKRGEFDFRDFLPYLPSTPIHNYAFINQRNNQFKNKAQALGFDEAEFSNGAAYGDLDNDGDLDLVINNVNMPASVYENTSSGTNYLHVQLQNENGDNRLGIGATVTLKTPDNEYVQQNYTARGFQSSVSPGLIFGLGAV
ncbi:MAG: CRTAC1 family protein [Bacteroidota bacterium]